MANTPIIAHNVVIEIDDETSAAIVVSTSANKVELIPSYRTGTYNEFGNAWDRSNDGGKGWKVKCQIFWSKEAAEPYLDILDNWETNRGLRTISIYIPANSSGGRKYTGDVRLTGEVPIELDRESDEVVMVEFEAIADGALTKSTIA
jgi:hypothetical protein